MIQNGHSVDSRETHVFTDSETQMSQVILMIKDESFLELGYCPLYTIWMSKAILRAREDSNREVQQGKIIVWWINVTVLLEIFIGSVIISFEIVLVFIQGLTVMNEVSISSTRREIRQVHIFSTCFVNRWIHIPILKS